MIQERCNNVMLLHCHKNKTYLLDMPAIMKDFVSAHDARKKCFWELLFNLNLMFIVCKKKCLHLHHLLKSWMSEHIIDHAYLLQFRPPTF